MPSDPLSPVPAASDLAAWLTRIETRHPAGIALGLERVGEVAARMALPSPARYVITVGGTNGKGSTVAFIEAMARAAGWRVGSYTSPHLLRYNERVCVDGAPLDDAAIVAGFEAVEAARGQTPLTYFETGTLAAWWCFTRQPLDLVVLEVGLGGRLDAVNLVDPDVAVITTVDLDHQAWLGPDRETIGTEKAGIARAGRPLVLGEDDPPSSVLRHAYAIGASAIRAGCDFFDAPAADATQWTWRELGAEFDLPLPALAAPVQRRNAATAIAALRALPEEIAPAALAEGLRAARLPGRLQRVTCGGRTVWLDVAHNRQAAAVLARWLALNPVPGRILAVFAALADKDIAAIVAALDGAVDAWYLAGLDDAGTRSRSVEGLAAAMPARCRVAALAPEVATALARALADAQDQEDRVIVFGSFHTVAAALRVCAASGGPVALDAIERN